MMMCDSTFPAGCCWPHTSDIRHSRAQGEVVQTWRSDGVEKYIYINGGGVACISKSVWVWVCGCHGDQGEAVRDVRGGGELLEKVS